MKIAVAGGHSAVARGAVGYLDEYIEDRKVAAALIDELKNRGHSVVNCSNEKTTQGSELAEECRLANNSGADLFVAIHFNAGGGTGNEVWYYSSSSKSKQYAVKTTAKLASVVGWRNRGAKATTGLYVLRHTSMPAILVEVCFVDTKSDADTYKKVGYQKIAAAIADGICGTNLGSTGNTSAPSVPAQKPKPSGGSNMSIRSVQSWVGTTQDGIYGPKTKAGLIKKLQSELNKQFGKGLAVDGIWGPKTKAACVNVKQGAQGNLTKTLQGCLICRGYNTNGFDGIFGSATKSAVRSFQSSVGISVDGIAGKNTWTKLLG